MVNKNINVIKSLNSKPLAEWFKSSPMKQKVEYTYIKKTMIFYDVNSKIKIFMDRNRLIYKAGRGT